MASSQVEKAVFRPARVIQPERSSPALYIGSVSPLNRPLVVTCRDNSSVLLSWPSPHAGPSRRVAQGEFRATRSRIGRIGPIRLQANGARKVIVDFKRSCGERSVRRHDQRNDFSELKRNNLPRCGLACVVGFDGSRQNARSTPEGFMPAWNHYCECRRIFRLAYVGWSPPT